MKSIKINKNNFNEIYDFLEENEGANVLLLKSSHDKIFEPMIFTNNSCYPPFSNCAIREYNIIFDITNIIDENETVYCYATEIVELMYNICLRVYDLMDSCSKSIKKEHVNYIFSADYLQIPTRVSSKIIEFHKNEPTKFTEPVANLVVRLSNRFNASIEFMPETNFQISKVKIIENNKELNILKDNLYLLLKDIVYDISDLDSHFNSICEKLNKCNREYKFVYYAKGRPIYVYINKQNLLHRRIVIIRSKNGNDTIYKSIKSAISSIMREKQFRLQK